MATMYAGNSTRPHWGGANSTIDQHLEKYDSIRDSKFLYESIFVNLSSQRNVASETNTYRFDRLNTSQVLGRAEGADIVSQKVTSDKALIIVEMMMYIRNPIGYMDKWTGPDYLADMAKNNGSAFAKAFDEAHWIRLIKARSWVAPAHLKPAFNDGMSVDVTIKGGTALTSADIQANADAVYLAIGKIVEELIIRDADLSKVVCGMTPKMFSILTNHNKLINKDYSMDNGDFAGRRVVQVHGISVFESTSFPKSVNANHILSTTGNSNAFNVTADDLKGQIVVFDKDLALITVTAQPFVSDFWDDKQQKTFVLDCHSMWTVDTRRPDVIGTVMVTETTTP